MNNKIHYTYMHCSKEDFENEVSFDEAVFSKKLGELFELDLQIDRIDVVFDLEKGQSSNPFKCTVNVVSPKAGLTHSESGEDVAKVARASIDKVVMELHDKNKQLHSHK